MSLSLAIITIIDSVAFHPHGLPCLVQVQTVME